MRRRLLTLIAVAASGFALATGGVANAGQDSAAVAINTKDNSTLVKVVFKITKIVNGQDVTATNAAAAVASCNSCETVAIAFQIVLASGSPSVVIPQNIALAMNVDCNLCQTLADAYQWVYAGGPRMTFTKDGRRRIKDIQRQLHELEQSNLPIDQIHARVVELAAQVQEVLNTELVPVEHGSGGGGESSDGDETAPDDTGTSTPPAPADTGTQSTPTDTGTTTPTDTGTSATPTPADTGTQTTPTDTGTTTTPSDTGTSTTPTDTGTQTAPGG